MNSVKCTILFIVVASIYGTEQRKNNALQNLKTVSFKQSQEVPLDQNLHKDVPGPLKARKRRTRNVTRSRNAINDATIKQDLRNNFYNIGMRQDPNLQDCQNSEFKTTFPDVDYTLLGYNILDGFPMATGHDPGFTYPIFKAEYSTQRQTADCRYSVPNGLVVIPDIACAISFSSTTIQNSHEYDEALSVSASNSAGGWGLSFSASAGYKQEFSEIATGESVLILSSASCHYYFSKVIPDQPPAFDDVFLQWLYKLNATNWNPELYFTFVDTYGTHFPTEVTFGARFIYQFKMDSETYETKRSQGIDVAVQASYAGLFSAGGGFNMDSSQRQAASDFSKSVTTQTITVGAAPPSNGDAMTWASEVKDSPVPTAYVLSSIEQLFSERYMGHLNIDYKRIGNLIATNKHEYCLYLQKEGKINSCEKHGGGIELNGTRLFQYFTDVGIYSISECIEVCIKELECVATTICSTCPVDRNKCYLFKESTQSFAQNKEPYIWHSNILLEKITTEFQLEDTAVVGIARGFENDNDKHANLDECMKLCRKDTYCVAYSYCDCPNQSVQCQLFSKENIRSLQYETSTTTGFISPNSNRTNIYIE